MAELAEADLDPDPLSQLADWFGAAQAAGVELPEGVALATATPDGVPSLRMVLLKGFGENGLSFHTSYESRKGRELAENPRGALLLYWHPLGRQVRVEGRVERVAPEESDAYFRTRSPESRLSAWASPQSEPVSGREELERRVEDARARYGDDPPLPPHWGGFRLVPERWEFWQHRENRLHDRFRYEPDGSGGWRIQRLAP